MTTQEEIGWLAGIMDGEGSVVLVQGSEKRKTDGLGSIGCRVLIAVCDLEILRKYTQILSDLEVSYRYVRQDKYMKEGAKYSRPNPVVQVYIARLDSVVKLLDVITPHLTLKKKVAVLVREVAQWRLDNARMMQYHRGPEYDYLRKQESLYWERYRSEFVGKARSHSRSIMEAVIDPCTPIHWPD
jgi:hypothetical protein